MKKTFFIQLFVVAVLALGLMACDTRQDRDVTMDDRGTDTYTPGTGTDTRTGTGLRTDRDFYFFDDSRDYSYEERNQFRQDVQESKNRLDQEISRLESHIGTTATTDPDTRDDHQEKFNELRTNRDRLEAEMRGFNRATNDNWDDFRSNVQSAWNDVEDSYEDLLNEIDDDTDIRRDRMDDRRTTPQGTQPGTETDRY
jgi:peptidoglycan hydrolase CwlO-like protein